MNLLKISEYDAPDIDVEEISGVPELPVTGWVIHTRSDSVRLIGFINRGTIERPNREATIILHMPPAGFLRSIARSLTAWRGVSTAFH